MTEIKEKFVGQIEVTVEDGEGGGHSVDFDVDEWKKLGLKPDDWVKYTEYDNGDIKLEKINPCDYCKNGHIKRELD